MSSLVKSMRKMGKTVVHLAFDDPLRGFEIEQSRQSGMGTDERQWLGHPGQSDVWLGLGRGLPGLVPVAGRPDCKSRGTEAQQRESNQL
jgi:hypothetical protein